MSKFKDLVTFRIQDTLDQLTYEDDTYRISYKYLGYNEHKNVSTSDSYYNMITAMVTMLDKTTGEQVQSCVDLLKMLVPTERGYRLGKGYKQIMTVTDLSSGWFLLEPKKGDGEETDIAETDKRESLQYNSKLLRRRFYFFCKKGKIEFSTSKAGDSSIPVSCLLQALSGKGRDELILLLGNNKYISHTFEEEMSTQRALELTARALDLRMDNFNSTSLYNEITDIFFRYDERGLNSAGYHRYCKNTLFLKRALNQILGKDLEVKKVRGRGTEVIPKGTELTEDLLKRIDSDPGIDTLYVLQNDVLHCLKKYPANPDCLSVNELLTMINIYALALNGYGGCDQLYDLTSRNLLSYEDHVLSQLSINVNKFSELIIKRVRELISRRVAKFDLIDILLGLPPCDTDKLFKFLRESDRILQTTCDTNLLNKISVDKKIVSSYKGNATKDEISVQEHERNRYDPVDQPESSKIGKVHYPTLMVKMDELGNALAPYHKVVNGVPTDELVYLSAADEEGEYVAVYEEDFSGDFVKCYLGGSVVDVPKQQVKYKEVSPQQSIGEARSWIPFAEFNNSKRLLMGANHQRQAIFVTGAERPYVSTGSFGLLNQNPVTARDVLKDYYDLYKESLGCSEEEFCSLSLKINSTSFMNGERVLHLEILGSDKYDAQLIPGEVPRNKVTTVRFAFMCSSDEKQLYSNEIMPKPGNIYKGDDILYTNINISTEKKDVVECTDYGEFPPDSYDIDFALGKNLLVAYKTYEGKTIEDAITIRKSLCHSDLTCMSMVDIDYECFREDGVYEEEFLVSDHSAAPDYILSKGLPRVGTYLGPGDIVMCKTRTYADSTTGENQEKVQLVKRLDANTSGEVVSAEIFNDKVAVVVLAQYNAMETGDKMAGRYGNKGVVAKVVPDEEMPYIEETGEIIDVILNPLGIPSRMNLGQALEIILGRAAQKEGKCCIVSPFNKNALPFVKEMREKHEVYPQILVDGRTGQRFERPVEVGIEYMLTLQQKVRSKSKSVAITSSIDQSNGQPQDSTGAQAVGEMETWALEVAGCSKLLQDLFTFQSDDFHSVSNLKGQIEEYPGEISHLNGVNRNNIILQAVLLCMGIKLRNSEDGDYVRDIVSDEDIRALAAYPLNTARLESLQDPVIFGDTNRRVYKNNDRFGYIELGCKIINPYLASVLKVLEAIPVIDTKEGKGKVRTFIKSNKDDLINMQIYVGAEPDKRYGIPVLYPEKPENISALTGVKGLVHILENYHVSDFIEFYDKNRSRIDKPADALNQLYTYLCVMRDDGYDFKDLITTTFPVLPVAFRNGVIVKRQIHDIESLYMSLFSAVETCKMSEDVYNVNKVYRAISALLGVTDSKTKNLDKIPLASSYFGKSRDGKGKCREQVLKKRVNFSGRSVIIPDEYTMPVTQIGVPISMAFTIWKLHLISLLRHSELMDQYVPLRKQPNDVWYETLLTYLQTKNFYGFRDKLREFSGYKLSMDETRAVFQEVKDMLVEFLEDQKVIAGRQPTLHQYGIRAYDVKIVESKAIGINTLACSGYNADFDGDTMYIIAILDKDTQEDTMKRLTMKQSIVNPKDGESVIKLTQDMLLGIYVATMLHNNVASIEADDRYKNIYTARSIDSLKMLVDIGEINIHDLVSVFVEGRQYLSTAGRLLFNNIIPDGFTDKPFSNPLRIPGIKESDGFYDLKYDGLISKKGSKSSSLPVYHSVSKITMDLYENYDIDTTFDVYHKMMEFGFVQSDKSGVTLGVTDFYADLYNTTPGIVGKMENTSVDKYKEIYRQKELQINKAIAEGYISAEARSELLQSLGASLNQKVQKDANANLPRNNNLFIISDSGARGNAGQIGQTIGMAGTKMKTLTSSFDIPVMHSYAEGLTTYEMLMDIYASRQGVASTQVNTQDAGFALRQMIYMTNAVQITDDDCGAEPREFKVEYKDLKRITKYTYASRPADLICEDYDFLGDVVEVFDEDLEYVLDHEVLNHEIMARKDKDFKYVQNFLTNHREFTKDAINMILKKRVHYVCCEDYIYKLDYNISKFFRGYILNRFVLSDDEDLLATTVYPELGEGELRLNQTAEGETRSHQRGGYATEATVKYIEELNLESIRMRTSLDCLSGSGCCKKCYGLAYSTNELPELGEMIGIESAQSIGEPVTQLTMSLFHKGGVAGGSVTNGVDLNSSLLKGNLPKDDTKAKHAVTDSFVSVSKMGKVAVVGLNSGRIRCSTDELKVVDGEYVDQFDTITEGFIEYNSLGLASIKGSKYDDALKSCYIYETKDAAYAVVMRKPKGNSIFNIGSDVTVDSLLRSGNTVLDAPEFKRRQQLELLKFYNWNFSKEDIDVLPRHFELLVKVQTQTIKIVNSNLEGVRVGDLYNYVELKRKAIEEDGYFIYPLAVARQHEVVILNSGPISSLVFIDVDKNLRALMGNRQLIEERGFVGRMALGENLYKPGRKVLQDFSVVDKDVRRGFDTPSAISTGYREVVQTNQELVKTTGNVDELDLDLEDDIFFEFMNDTVASEVAAVDAVDSMNLFGEVEANPVEQPSSIFSGADSVQGMNLFDSVPQAEEPVQEPDYSVHEPVQTPDEPVQEPEEPVQTPEEPVQTPTQDNAPLNSFASASSVSSMNLFGSSESDDLL